jgi:hypothetical protein
LRCIVLNNGAHIYDQELEIIGNFQGSVSNATVRNGVRPAAACTDGSVGTASVHRTKAMT